MNKKWTFISLTAMILALYVGMAIRTEHPTEQLFQAMKQKINEAHVISFKSGHGVTRYDADHEEVLEQWQFKRKGTYDVWSKYLYFQNLTRFEDLIETDIDDEAEKQTSLSEEAAGNMIALPIKEAYFKNGMYFEQQRASGLWSYQERDSYDLIELLPFNAELLNRYAKYYKADNRGSFVVYFFSVDPNYLTRSFPNLLESDGLSFPMRFKEGTIKILAYPDTNLPRRAYSFYVIENLDTGEIYEYNFSTYFSEDESYSEMEEPAIPRTVLRHKE